MDKPVTLTDALALLRRSRLVTEERLSVYLDGMRTRQLLNQKPDELFSDMVRRGLLTAFQASQLGHGRWSGFELGSYRVLDRLGAGGMGQVYLAEHTTIGRRVALKVLSRRTASPLALERFVREARSAAKLDHPNIIHVYDIDTAHDPPFIVMEYADGITLQAAVARSGPFAPGDAAWVAQQMALGLEEAFRHGLVHRDVKPANVLLDRRGVARLLDLGIVRIEGENITGDSAREVILGTIDYLAPEQAIDSSNVDTRADIYSLGATLYFLLTGFSPLPPGGIRERLKQLQTVQPPELRRMRCDVPEGLDAVLSRMLAKSAKDRYQTPKEAAAALAPFAVPNAAFPANLFRHMDSTLSDTAGPATPVCGIVLPVTEITDRPLEEPSLEFYRDEVNLDATAPSVRLDMALSKGSAPERPPLPGESGPELIPTRKNARSWPHWLGWSAAAAVLVFGMLKIAFYVRS